MIKPRWEPDGSCRSKMTKNYPKNCTDSTDLTDYNDKKTKNNMEGEKFGEKYLQCAEDIKKILERYEIYDMDLLHDTYIALYEYAEEKNRIRNFVNTFVDFYWKRVLRRREHESYYEAYDDEQMYNLGVADKSDLEYREQVGKRVDRLIRYYAEHPQPREHDHKLNCKILRLYRQGLTEREISHKVKISQQAVNQSLARTIERLKVVAKWLYNRTA